MVFTDYLVIFSSIIVLFVFVMLCLTFGRFNNRVLKKSFIEGKIFVYTMFLSAMLFVATIVYSNFNQNTNTKFLVYGAIFLTYAIAIMITLLVSCRPLSKIKKTAKEIAKGKKNLQFDFEGATEFKSISDSLNAIQQNYRLSDKKLNKKEHEYQKFVPKEYLKYFGKTKLEEVKVGDNVTVKLCTMFCDLRSSYFSSETLSLADNFTIIKEFIDEVTDTVHKNSGFVDKYMGDGVLAIFDCEDNALKSANEIAKRIDYKNIVSIGKEAIKYGISLNSGMCVVGVVGEEKQKQFITDANHELKTPLTLIMSNVDIVEEELGKSEWLDDIRSEGQRMTKLINRLVSLSRMDEEQNPLQKENFDLTDVVYDVASEFVQLAFENNKILYCLAQPKVMYKGDEAHIRQLMSILLDNAVKYCDTDGEIHIDLTEKHHPVITVENTYADVDNIELDKLFDRFYRADKARTYDGSFGIGLSLAKEIVNKHGGEISVYKKRNTIGFKVELK